MTTRAQYLSKERLVDDADFRALLHLETERLRIGGQHASQALADRKASPAINKRGGFKNLTFDLGDARFSTPGYIEVPSGGWSIVYSVQGSTPGGALDFDFDLGGQQLNVQPGAILRAPVERFTLRRNSGSVTAGTVVLRIQVEPDAEYDELARGSSSGSLTNPSGTGSGPAGATTQTYNSAAGNIPTAATDGISLAGLRGVRAIVKASGANTITVGVGGIAWWQFSTADNAWGETDMFDVPLANGVARNIWVPNDKEIWVPEGRIYAEVRSMTNSGGSGAFTLRLQGWGG